MRLIVMLRGLLCGWDQYLWLLLNYQEVFLLVRVKNVFPAFFCPVLDTQLRTFLFLHSKSVGIAT
jgi:hypothetical protein